MQKYLLMQWGGNYSKKKKPRMACLFQIVAYIYINK